jgi:hypothetical protein
MVRWRQFNWLIFFQSRFRILQLKEKGSVRDGKAILENDHRQSGCLADAWMVFVTEKRRNILLTPFF